MRVQYSSFPVYSTKITNTFLLFLSMACGQLLAQNSTGIVKTDQLPKVIKAEVIGIQDGDTIELKFIFTGKKAGRRMGQPLRIRLLHVNSPERGKPYYKIAKQFTSEKCFRKTVRIIHEGKFDKYGRLLGEVVLPDGKFLNKELVKKGFAVHFKKYSSSTEYSNLEIVAKKQKLGIWSIAALHSNKLNFDI